MNRLELKLKRERLAQRLAQKHPEEQPEKQPEVVKSTAKRTPTKKSSPSKKMELKPENRMYMVVEPEEEETVIEEKPVEEVAE